MRLHLHALAAVVALAMPALGQTVSKAVEKPDGPKEKLWLLEASGIGGWAAPSQAIRARAALEKVKGVRKLEFDTTGIGYFVAAKGFDPTKSVLNEALKKKRLGSIKVRTLKEVELPKTVARWELAVRGLQWMTSATQARAALQDIEGISRVHPYGHNGKVLIYWSDKEAIDREGVEKALKRAGLPVRRIRRK